ncbi:unnamed protein product [Closterium sp. NIES-53]
MGPLIDVVKEEVLAAVRMELGAHKQEVNDLRQMLNAVEEKNEATTAVMEEREREVTEVKGEVNAVKGEVMAVKGEVIEVKGEMNAVKGEQIKSASRSTNLTLVDFHGLSYAMLAHVSTMTHLKSISLEYASCFSAEGIKHLYMLLGLETLYLDNTGVSDSALEGIVSLTSLRYLYLERTKVTDAGLAHLMGLSSLKLLWLSYYKLVSDAGMVHVERLTRLENLSVDETKVTDDGLQQLTALTKLGGLKRVLLVPGLCANLLSTKALSEAGMKMEMMGTKVFKATLDGRVLWDLRGGKDMHRSMWEIPVLPWKEAAARLAAEAVRGGHASHVTIGGGGDGSDGGLLVHGGGAIPSVTPSTGETDWLATHRHFGHVALPQLQQLFKEERVKGLRIKGEPKEVVCCETCLTSKFSRFPFHSAVGKSSDPVDLMHVDLMGPMKVKGDGGAVYSMTMVDDHTRLTWSFPLAKKSDAARVIIEEWLPMVERESGKRVKAVCSDRAGEFLGAEFWSWLKRHGIKQQLTTAYTPQSNGMAERANRTIVDDGRTILVDSGLPLWFWPLAICHATVIKNQVLTHVGGQHWVPMEKWSGKKPLVYMLHVFGCMGLVHVPKEKRDKLQAATVWAVHLGLARGSKGWLMWDPKSKTVFTTRDAKFMEGLMFQGVVGAGEEQGHHSAWNRGAEEKAAYVEEVQQQGEAPIAKRSDTEEVQQPTPSSKLPPRRTTQGKRDNVRGGAKEVAAKERPKRAAHPRDFLKYERLGVPKALLVQEEEDEEKGDEGEMEQVCCFGVNLPHELASMEEALAGDDREAWLKALDCTWVLRVKTDAEGRLERRKTRLVIKGFQQREGIDFQEVFAPVAKVLTLRLLLPAAAVCGWKAEKMDVKTAFLYGVVDEEIYMKQPEGYDDGSRRVCKLNKAIYGLKQAPRCWYARLVEALEALGFKVSGCDERLFMTEGEEEKVFLLVYVNDILLFSPSLERIKEVQGKLKGWLHQHKYLAAMGEKYGLEEGRSVKTLLPSGFQLNLDEEECEVLEYELQHRFQSMVGSLMYASVNTRPDIAFSVSQLARVVFRPLQEQLDAAERLDFRRKELTAAAGEGGGSAYGMKGFKGSGSKKGKAKEGSGGEQYSGGKRGNKGGKRCGDKCWYFHVEGHPWFKCRKLPDGWRPGQPSIEGSKGVHGAMGEGMGSEKGDGRDGGHGGMFYHVGEACSEDMVVPASKVALHRSSHWVIDMGAFITMTNREDLLDKVIPSKAATVVSATGQVVPVRGEGRAMFMGADGRLVGLKRALLVPGLCANLLSTKALSEAGMKMEMMGTKVFKATLDGCVLWDLRGGKDMHRSMWEIPVLPWKEAAARLAAEAVRGGHASHVTSGGGGDGSDGGLLVHGGGAIPSVTPSTGETDWLTAHRRFGHVALPQLQKLFKEVKVKGLRIKGEPKEVGSCETCLTSKFSRFPFHSVVGQSSDPEELVHVDLVGPMKKSDAARVIIEEWLPMVEQESGKRMKAIHSDCGGEFLGAEFRSWLKQHGIKQQLTTAYTPQSNGVAERANRTIIEGGRTILVDSGLPLRFWPLAIRHATVIKNWVLINVGGQHWVPMEKWSGKNPLVDMIRVFGCMGLVHVPKEKRDKLRAAAIWAVHLGLAQGSKGWLK